MQKLYESWGRYPNAVHTILPFHWRNDLLNLPDSASVLPFGLGRSYGDSCLNDGQALIPTRNLRRFISFDPATDCLRCEAGVSLAEILDVFVPRGLFLPVTPGTKSSPWAAPSPTNPRQESSCFRNVRASRAALSVTAVGRHATALLARGECGLFLRHHRRARADGG